MSKATFQCRIAKVRVVLGEKNFMQVYDYTVVDNPYKVIRSEEVRLCKENGV